MPSFKEIYNSERPVISLEFFPPKSRNDIHKTTDLMSKLAGLKPDYMTVTYGAGGGTRELTRELVAFIANELGITAVSHLTCVGHSRDELSEILNQLGESGLSHILALRGDPPRGNDQFVAHPEGFSCARDLADFIKQRGGFSTAVAGYPEVHPEAKSKEAELIYLKSKQDAGAEVVITQLFFDSSMYFDFVNSARAAGVTIPISPGLMPIGNVNQLKRFTEMCGASIPENLLGNLERIADDPAAVKEFGITYATKMAEELLEGGAPGLHLYTLNKSMQVGKILKNLRASGWL